MKISDSLTEKLLVVASKISNQKHMYAIKTAFTTLDAGNYYWSFLYVDC